MQDAFSRMELLVGNTGVKKTQQGENCSIRSWRSRITGGRVTCALRCGESDTDRS